ncbi:MAG: hypothetical protein KDD36_13510 [Flavobacteriales bacterium]|nr:hypothetical protein [Flavobacteriales bacterium]
MKTKAIMMVLLLGFALGVTSCQKHGCPAYKNPVIPMEKGSPFSFKKKKKSKSKNNNNKGLFGNSGIRR